MAVLSPGTCQTRWQGQFTVDSGTVGRCVTSGGMDDNVDWGATVGVELGAAVIARSSGRGGNSLSGADLVGSEVGCGDIIIQRAVR
jgi:hypothetical protein